MPEAAITNTRQVQYDANGRLVGIDGVLDQVGEALARKARPIIRDEIIPAIRADKELQARVGEAVGRGAVQELKPFLFVLTGAAVFMAWNSYRRRQAEERLVLESGRR